MDPITRELRAHYADTFRLHGASSLGVDWRSEVDLQLRYDKMLDVVSPEMRTRRPTILDVGCGYGGLYGHAMSRGLELAYTGIDVVSEMISHARATWPSVEFHESDLFGFQPQRRFDFVVCNGILTQKLTTSIREMDRYAQRLIREMFEFSTVGVVFNVMTSKVDYTKEHLYHRHPADMLAWCMAEITDNVRIDHAYPLYEYSVYLYQNRASMARESNSEKGMGEAE